MRSLAWRACFVLAAGLFTGAFNFAWSRALFPLIMLVMVWALIAALMPSRAPAARAAAAV